MYIHETFACRIVISVTQSAVTSFLAMPFKNQADQGLMLDMIKPKT
jgi:hypothetical protein